MQNHGLDEEAKLLDEFDRFMGQGLDDVFMGL